MVDKKAVDAKAPWPGEMGQGVLFCSAKPRCDALFMWRAIVCAICLTRKYVCGMIYKTDRSVLNNDDDNNTIDKPTQFAWYLLLQTGNRQINAINILPIKSSF